MYIESISTHISLCLCVHEFDCLNQKKSGKFPAGGVAGALDTVVA